MVQQTMESLMQFIELTQLKLRCSYSFDISILSCRYLPKSFVVVISITLIIKTTIIHIQLASYIHGSQHKHLTNTDRCSHGYKIHFSLKRQHLCMLCHPLLLSMLLQKDVQVIIHIIVDLIKTQMTRYCYLVKDGQDANQTLTLASTLQRVLWTEEQITLLYDIKSLFYTIIGLVNW